MSALCVLNFFHVQRIHYIQHLKEKKRKKEKKEGKKRYDKRRIVRREGM
jgi:hypothetical protein